MLPKGRIWPAEDIYQSRISIDHRSDCFPRCHRQRKIRSSTTYGKTIQQTVDKLVEKVSKIPIIGWFVKWVWTKVTEWVDVLVKEVLYSDEKGIPGRYHGINR